ncbi:ATP:cob(I)alamin adenosyltransferase [Arthrobacter sp. JSM 101049]|uniref:ATP:cob(I)alamin adenosyltransferase n=1 Tax=Arthrobacter sp. JSM 101049 TaxID=929097 RepID=UPI003565DB44
MTANGESANNEISYDQHGGDNGRTVFGGHGELAKTDAMVIAYSECDAANASLALAMAVGGIPPEVSATLISAQNDLYDLMSDLLEPYNSDHPAAARMIPAHSERIDRAIEHFRSKARDLSGKILPGGTMTSAVLYQARAAVRRAELAVWKANETYPELVNDETARYLNHLSTLLFVLARVANVEHGDVEWVPEASVQAFVEDSE